MFDKTALYKISTGVYVTGVALDGRLGGSTVDSFIQASSANPPHVILCSMNRNNTTSFIVESGRFSISVLPQDVNPFYIANFGYQSGRDVDKWANVDYELTDGLPVLKDAAAVLICRVVSTNLLPTHHVFTAVVEQAKNGNGEPLLYGYYQSHLKDSVKNAFDEYKKNDIIPQASASRSEALPSPGQNEKWVCTLCGYEYEGEIPFEDLPDTWTCPLCGVTKEYFEKRTV